MILLINLPSVRIRYNISGIYPSPPIGLASIAAVLEKNGVEAGILDMHAAGLDCAGLARVIRERPRAVYGLSCNIFNLRYGLQAAVVIKAAQPEAKIVLGGPCSVFPAENVFAYGGAVDVLVRGEGEIPMSQLCKVFSRGRFSDTDLAGIPGIAFRSGGKVIVTPDAPYLDFNSLPFPKRELLAGARYRAHPPFDMYPPSTLMETSRGCPHQCSFCSLSRPVSERGIDGVVDEIREVTGNFGCREIYFTDPTFTHNQGRIAALCDAILEGGIRVAWTCRTRVDAVSAPLLKAMARAGCYMISFGIESGSQEFLNSVNKGITLEDIRSAFDWSARSGMRTIAYVILDSSETRDGRVRSTRGLLERIRPDFVLYSRLLAKPGSRLGDAAVAGSGKGYDRMLRFYLSGDRKGWGKSLFPLYAGFYFDIRYLWKRLTALKGWRDLINLVRGAYLLVSDAFRVQGVFDR